MMAPLDNSKSNKFSVRSHAKKNGVYGYNITFANLIFLYFFVFGSFFLGQFKSNPEVS